MPHDTSITNRKLELKQAIPDDVISVAGRSFLPRLVTGAVIVATWPKPKGGLGFPARAFAILP